MAKLRHIAIAAKDPDKMAAAVKRIGEHRHAVIDLQ